ncbi:uncharacterized protein C8Q71DRAFT_862606 [Rhodofomes roseus]|uniref:CCHC-type domain-containing protein n=1 Tax=Rhodofomes roseus TaxID=34475 RepID=A0ABQ8K1I5_9APHY|nr:uncharacterized protein C8Q71DRAFT_862606 [Rhodofomes roseus]KAH9830316.1 hypothetical protein C8Q71DRAFT_862606 [Rhodofomes roseus]
MATTTGVAGLPMPGSKCAPRKFKGRYSEVKSFLQHYERICTKLGIINAKDLIDNVTQYCSRQVRQFIESLPSFEAKDPNWETLKKDVLTYFDADRDDKKYKVRHLESYVLEARKKSTIKTLGAWREYTRKFLTISGWLKKNGRISVDEEALYFWKGIPRKFRQTLEPRLLASKPTYDLSKPFSMTEVNQKAEALLQRNRFDADRLPSDDEDDSDEESDSDDSSSDSSDDSSSESEEDIKSKKSSLKNKKRKLTKKKHSSKKNDTDEDEDTADLKKAQAARRRAAQDEKKKANEVEELIRQMNKMSLSDPEYGVLYFRACTMSPLAASAIRPPVLGSSTQRSPTSNAFTSPQSNPSAAPSPTQPSAIRPPMKCYGCGGTGHGIGTCAEINTLMAKGVIARDASGRLVMKDGSRIFRNMDETFVSAIQRQTAPTAHYITTEPKVSYYAQATIEEYESEEEQGNVHVADEEDSENTFSFAGAERGTTSTRNARERATKGPLIPPVSVQEKINKPRATQEPKRDKPPHLVSPPQQSPDATRSSARLRGDKGPPILQHPGDRATQPTVPTEHNRREMPTTPKQPIDVTSRQFDADNDDEIMEDVSPPKQSSTQSRTTDDTTKRSEPAKAETPKRTPRQSQVQAQVDTWHVLGKVLNTPVTLPVGEIFGISKEMSSHLQEVLKPKAPPKNIVAAAFGPRSKGALIYLRMEVDERPVTAIIDTGSQLNIASRKLWKTHLNRPMDIARSCQMNDANGGAGALRGLVENVPLTCGNVRTFANLYIGERVPFDLLLGRPWQRGNYVSIDERVDGTYLMFKNQDLEVQHEILVMPDGYDPAWSYEPAVWYANSGDPPSATDAPSNNADHTATADPQRTEEESGEDKQMDSTEVRRNASQPTDGTGTSDEFVSLLTRPLYGLALSAQFASTAVWRNEEVSPEHGNLGMTFAPLTLASTTHTATLGTAPTDTAHLSIESITLFENQDTDPKERLEDN